MVTRIDEVAIRTSLSALTRNTHAEEFFRATSHKG